MGRVYLHLALTLSGRLLTLFQHCDCVSSLQDGFEEREIMIDGPLFNLLITGARVAIIQVPLSLIRSAVTASPGAGAALLPLPSISATGVSSVKQRSGVCPSLFFVFLTLMRL